MHVYAFPMPRPTFNTYIKLHVIISPWEIWLSSIIKHSNKLIKYQYNSDVCQKRNSNDNKEIRDAPSS